MDPVLDRLGPEEGTHRRAGRDDVPLRGTFSGTGVSLHRGGSGRVPTIEIVERKKP
ncbi:MAG: hypothetical protein IPN90_11370 [Elusimicrobia bacterium]|nr:hypothetical protein [Elusimicrobiota bacterium]